MSNEFELSPANQELERALGGLKPAASHLDRDLVMFRAGQASVRKKAVFWPVASSVLSVLLGLSWIVQFQSYSHRREYTGHLEAKLKTTNTDAVELAPRQTPWVGNVRESTSDKPFSGTAYLALRNRVLKRGLDGLSNEQTGNDFGAVLTWRPYKMRTFDDAEI